MSNEEEEETSSEEKEKETTNNKPEKKEFNLTIEAVENAKEDTLIKDSADADVTTKEGVTIIDDIPAKPLLPHCRATEQKSGDSEVIEALLCTI